MVKKYLNRAAIAIVSAFSTLAMVSGVASAQTIETDDIVNGAVTSAKIANGSINYHDIGEAAVRSAEIANNSVTSDDIKAGEVRSSEIKNGSIVGGDIDSSTKIVLSPTFDDDNSNQSVEADATLDDYVGSSYGGAVMGNVMGTVDTSTTSVIGGLIGKYNVSTSGTSNAPQAAVVAEVGEDSAGTADAAVMAVLGGDSGALDAAAAYGVQYLNSTAGSQFTYGLDLSHAASGYAAVTYATADIRLSTGVTISSGSAAPSADCGVGSLYLRTGGAADSTLYSCTASNTWTAIDNV